MRRKETPTISEITRGLMESLEYELRAAWYMDYDYVHVYYEIPPYNRDNFSFTRNLLPTDVKVPPSVDGFEYKHTYDLESVDDEEVREVLRNE